MEKIDISHLQNEWRVIPNGFLYVLHTRQGEQIECNKFYGRIYPDYAGGITEDDANKVATLFAGAHDLLSALMDLISVCEENPSVPGQWWSKGVPTNEQLNRAKAAIAKATNTTQQ
jgi:hypothetical protein